MLCHSFAFLALSSHSGNKLIMTKREVCEWQKQWLLTVDCRFLWVWCDWTLNRSDCHLLVSHRQEADHWLIWFQFPLTVQKQEVKLISKSDHRQRTVQSSSKEDHILKQSCTPHASLVLCAWLWNMIHDQRKAYTVVFCAQHPKWAHCFTICRKKHTLQIPHHDRNLSHFQQNVFSSKRPDENKGPYSVFATRILSAELLHCCLELIMAHR